MRAQDKIRLRLRSLFCRPKVERELDDELRFHLDQLIEENLAEGVAWDEARRLAWLKMGGITQFQEACRDMRRMNFTDDLLRDLRYAGRSLRRNPGFAALAVLIMALGIGANTAVFSVVNAVLLKPPGFRDADRIVTLSGSSTTGRAGGLSSKPVSILDFRDWHDQSDLFEAMAYYAAAETAVMPGDTAEYTQAARVSPEFFRVFAVEPIIGRIFTADDVKQGSGGVLVISHAYWQSHFGGNPRVLGRTVRVTDRPMPIIGVMRPDFNFPDKTALPGVLAAGATMAPPGQVRSEGSHFLDHMPAQSARRDMSAPGTVLSIVAPGTFAALGIPLKSGRDFNDGDTYDTPFVAVINEALVRESLKGANPIGRTIFCPFDTSTGMTIIGVVGDVRQHGPAREPMPECYMTYQQHRTGLNGSTLSVVVRAVGNPRALAETARRLAAVKSPDVPVKFTTLEAALSENVALPRFRTLLFGLFAGLAVCLAMAGVYGMMAYAVGQRSREIGLRMALGASTGTVLRLVLAQGLALAAAGLALGLAASVAGTRLLATMLFQVQPNDPLVYVGVTVLLGIVTMAASYIPASRAARIDPLAALRQE